MAFATGSSPPGVDQDYQAARRFSGCFQSPSLYALKNSCGKVQDPNLGILLGFHVNCDSVGCGERIGNHLKFLAVKPD